MSIATGTRLGQYEVQDFIGSGAMGLVYRAYHSDLERTGAVKVLQAISPDADTVARFRHEAQAIAQLRHPNIVNVYDFGAFQGTPYMIVEYIPGGSLAGRMAQGRLDHATSLRYLRGIAAGLDYAHSHGVVHRDVKPANVLITSDDTPVLADFGLAKLLQGSSLKSMTGVTTGTPAYMAPEQVTGSSVGPAADLYSLASIAYEMLTGVIPFDGEALMELLYAQVHRYPTPPSGREASLNPAVDAVIMRGLAKDPAARWESGGAFVDALFAALQNKAADKAAYARTVVMAPPLASTIPFAMTASPAPVAPPAAARAAPTPNARPRPHRKRRVVVIAGVVLAVLLIGFFLLATRPPTMSLSAYSVAPGEDLVISASHVPANQSGQIELWSALHVFPFRANSSGDVSIDITIPRDIGFGDHLVKLCYGGSCRAQQTLHVIQSLGLASPSASPSPSSSTSPSGSPSGSPVSTPGHSPSPGATLTPQLSILKYYVKPGDSETVGGRYFPGSAVTIYFIQGKTLDEIKSAPVASGAFTTAFAIPSNAVTGPAAVRVCYTGGCAYATISVS